MIASCPQCRARYRIARERIGPHGSRLRCTRCECVFRVQAPPPEPAGGPTQPPSSSANRVAPPRVSSGGRALVVESDPQVARGMVGYLTGWGFEVEHVSDGVAGLVRLFRTRTDVAVLGGRLSGIGAPVLCEIVRRCSERRSQRLIRVRCLEEPQSAPEFEADEMLEPRELPVGLGAALERLGFIRPKPVAPPAREAPPAASPAVPPRERPGSADSKTPEAPTVSSRSGSAPASSAGRATRSTDPDVAAAERLARIIVSDIILYNEQKFARAVQAGNCAEALKPELDEGMELFRRRIPEQVRARRDFLLEELKRRAEKAA